MPGAPLTLFITQELLPFHSTGGMAVLSRDLPAALGRCGWPHVILLPYIAGITNLAAGGARHGIMRRSLVIAGETYEYELFEIISPDREEPILFVGQDRVFSGSIYDDRYRLHRSLILGDAAVAYLAEHGDSFGIVQALDQLSALSLAHIRVATGNRYRLIFNILSAEYDFPAGQSIDQLSFDGKAAMLARFGPSMVARTAIELGIAVADWTITSSPAYADALSDSYRSAIGDRADRLVGIGQGIDVHVWDPQAQGRLFRPIRRETLEQDKATNHTLLVAVLFDLPHFVDESPDTAQSIQRHAKRVPDDRILISFVGRFCRAKGRTALYRLIDRLEHYPGLDLLLLIPTGAITDLDRAKLQALAARHCNLWVINSYDQPFAELVFAASHYVLMPSEQEPGGLCQKMAMRFGSPPLVTPAGGLKSSVINAFTDPGDGNGFMSECIDADSVLAMLEKVLSLRSDDPFLRHCRRNALATDVSWELTIGAYERIYSAPL